MTYRTTIEELGKTMNVSIDVEVEYDWNPPEPMVMHDRDGSGYPGSPGFFEYTAFRVTAFRDDAIEVKREDHPDWFEVLDRIAENTISSDDGYQERIGEELEAAAQ